MGETKFRAWSNAAEKMLYFGEATLTFGAVGRTNDHPVLAFPLIGKTAYMGTYELMQFSGTEDSEGNDVYKNDICMYHAPHPMTDPENGFTGIAKQAFGSWVVDNGRSEGRLFDECGCDYEKIGNAMEPDEREKAIERILAEGKRAGDRCWCCPMKGEKPCGRDIPCTARLEEFFKKLAKVE